MINQHLLFQGCEQKGLGKRGPPKFSWRPHKMERWIFKDLFQTVCWSGRRIWVCSQIPLPPPPSSPLTPSAVFWLAPFLAPPPALPSEFAPKLPLFTSGPDNCFVLAFCAQEYGSFPAVPQPKHHILGPGADNYFFPPIVSLYFGQWAQAKGCLVGNDKFIKLAPKMKVSLYWFWPNSFLKLNFGRMPLGGFLIAGRPIEITRRERLSTNSFPLIEFKCDKEERQQWHLVAYSTFMFFHKCYQPVKPCSTLSKLNLNLTHFDVHFQALALCTSA